MSFSEKVQQNTYPSQSHRELIRGRTDGILSDTCFSTMAGAWCD